jgi:hypothetical protein
MLARVYWSVGNLEASEKWQRRFLELDTQYADADLHGEYCLLAARTALANGRHTEARLLLDQAKIGNKIKLASPRLLVLSCELELKLLTGDEQWSEDDLDELIALHRRGRAVGLQDEVVVTLVRALRKCLRKNEADQLIMDYLTTYRRDGFAPASQLVDLATECEI